MAGWLTFMVFHIIPSYTYKSLLHKVHMCMHFTVLIYN